jgi:predicted DNA-binding protein
MNIPKSPRDRQIQISTLLPPELVRDLKKLSVATDKSMAAYVREGLEMVLETHADKLRNAK